MIVFRVDANEKVATGHLMRCLAIAEECRKRGEDCRFLLAEEKETDRIAERGFPYHVLNSSWDCLEPEVDRLCQYINNHPCTWLIVDTYQATKAYLKKLNQVCPVLYLDDFGREGYEVTAVLRYGVLQDGEQYERSYRQKGVQVLAGPEYIPLREEFQPVHLAELRKKQAVEHPLSVFITTGGTDPYHVTGRVLEYCLSDQGFCNCCYHVVVGSMNVHAGELQQMAEQYTVDGSSPVFLHYGVRHMSDLMCQCDYAVSAGGTTLYELCACGIPTVCFSFADNQLTGVRLLEKQRIMRYAGDARDGDISVKIGEHLAGYIGNPAETQRYINRMRQLVDGRGVCRIAEFLCQRRE